ncbi:MAG: InlB B-repeat-containing protein, partial [Candidatus Pacebacteria bacterium]|nr:InlB B-repeat-containing protein [Candidatus Paceibacterota bacterium]
FTSTYWDTQTSGTTTSAKGTGKTTAEMQTQSTFSEWDFTNVWVMNGYPILRMTTNTITYTAGSNGSITGTTSQLVSTGGSSTEVIATPNTGYHFVSWNDGVLTANRTDTNVLSSQSYTASFEINTYTVNYSAGENGSITGDTSQTISYGGFTSGVTAIPNTGYHFTSWSDGVLTASRTDVNITDNISVTANFEIDTNTLTYTAGEHGTISGSSTQIVNYGSNGTQVEAIPDEDYRFVQWSDGSTSTTRIDTNITENISFVADFVINQRTLVYIAGDNGIISGTATQSVTIGQSGATVTAVPNDNYHFVSWSDGITTASRTDTNVQNSLSVTANFAIDVHTLTYIAGTGGTINGSSTQSINHNSNGSEVIATPDSRYRFINWSDGNTSPIRHEENVIEDETITASFRKRSSNVYIYSTCTDFEYTDWSRCNEHTQTRKIISSYPLGCYDGDYIVEQSCIIKTEEDDVLATSTQEILSTTTEIIIKTEDKENNVKKETNKSITIFTKNLQLTDVDDEVKLLQKFLNSQGFIVSLTGAGSVGKETNYFGLLTKKALILYQEANAKEILTPLGLKKGTGYFGRATREVINRIFN